MGPDGFEQLPDAAQVWIYAFAAPLDRAEKELVSQRLDAFVPAWDTHGSPVQGAWQLWEDRFVVLVGYHPSGVSGCSIDTSVANFKWLKEKHGLDGLDRSLVYYRDAAGTVQAADRLTFQQMVDDGLVTGDTQVFDTALTTLAELRAGRFEQRLADSWHAKLFQRSRSSTG